MIVEIEENTLVIGISVDGLIAATQSCPKLAFFDETKNNFAKVTVIDPTKWLEAVCRELNVEDEDGSTILTKMFDKAFQNALENGAEGIEIEGLTF